MTDTSTVNEITTYTCNSTATQNMTSLNNTIDKQNDSLPLNENHVKSLVVNVNPLTENRNELLQTIVFMRANVEKL